MKKVLTQSIDDDPVARSAWPPRARRAAGVNVGPTSFAAQALQRDV